MKAISFLISLFLFSAFSGLSQGIPADTTTITYQDSTKTDDTTDDDAVDADTKDADSVAVWSYMVGLDGDFKSGNIQRTLLAFRGSFENEKTNRLWGFHTSPRFSWGTLNDVLAERETFLDINLTLGFHKHDIYGLTFGVFESSNLRKINTRFYGGLGLGWRAIGGKASPSERFKLTFTIALLHENTDYIIKDDISVWRVSNRVKIVWDIDKKKLVTFRNYTFIQPALDANYFRWNAISSLLFNLSKRFSFSLNFENSYESYVSPGLQNTDTHLTFGVLFKSL